MSPLRTWEAQGHTFAGSFCWEVCKLVRRDFLHDACEPWQWSFLLKTILQKICLVDYIFVSPLEIPLLYFCCACSFKNDGGDSFDTHNRWNCEGSVTKNWLILGRDQSLSLRLIPPFLDEHPEQSTPWKHALQKDFSTAIPPSCGPARPCLVA